MSSPAAPAFTNPVLVVVVVPEIVAAATAVSNPPALPPSVRLFVPSPTVSAVVVKRSAFADSDAVKVAAPEMM